MANYKISVEINLDGDNPLLTSKQLAKMLMENADEFQYYLQDEETNEVFSVDLSENDEEAVLPVTNYEPFIN